MRALLKLFSFLLILLYLPGFVLVTVSLAHFYMLTIGGASPGEPIFLDTLAPTIGASLTKCLTGILVIAVAYFSRMLVALKLRQDMDAKC
jgi:hypothetical protein